MGGSRRRLLCGLALATAALGLLVLLGVGALVLKVYGIGGPSTLAKAPGQELAPGSDVPPESLQIAYDPAAVDALWASIDPSSLPHRDGRPSAYGVYGDPADVDLDRQVVALWSAGESGTCPDRVRGVDLHDGALTVTTAPAEIRLDPTRICTADRGSYRTVVVLDRDQVPGQDELAGTRGEWRRSDEDRATPVRLTVYSG